MGNAAEELPARRRVEQRVLQCLVLLRRGRARRCAVGGGGARRGSVVAAQRRHDGPEPPVLDDGSLDGEVHLTQVGECVRGELTRALCAEHLKGTQPRRARRDRQRSFKHLEEELECALGEELLL